jgi:hypothetical protein
MDNRRKFSGIEVNPTSDELNLMPDSNRDGLFSIAKSLGNGSDFIISGVSAIITPGVEAVVSDGYVIINGEVLKVDPQTVSRTVGTDIYVFQKSITNGTSPDWDREFRDGSNHNVFEKNRAIVTNVSSAGSDLPIDGDQIEDVLTPILLEVTTLAKGLMSPADKIKLNSIATGAEVNVNTDWNSGSGDSELLNRPNVFIRASAAPQTFTIPSTVTVNHPSMDIISLVGAFVCKVNNNNFVVGDKIPINSDVVISGSAFNSGFEWWNESTTVSKFRIRSGGWRGFDKSTGGIFTILSTQWNVQVAAIGV